MFVLKSWISVYALLMISFCTLPDSAGCPIGWLEFGSSYYLLEETVASWEDAGKTCTQYQARLVTIETEEENMFLATSVEWEYAWLGGNDLRNEGFWEWQDGSKINWTNWAKGEPNNIFTLGFPQNCLQFMPPKQGLWDDGRCRNPRPYICEMNKDEWTYSHGLRANFIGFNGLFLESASFFSGSTRSTITCGILCAQTPHCLSVNIISKQAGKTCLMMNHTTEEDEDTFKSCKNCKLIIKSVI